MTSDQGRRFDDPGDTPSTSDSSSGLIHDAITEASRLVGAEIQLAKQEVAESLRAAVLALVTGSVAIFGFIAFLVMAVVTLVVAVPLHWVAELACAAVFLLIAIVGAVVAVGRVKRITPLRQTIETLKEDVEWAKLQMTLDKK